LTAANPFAADPLNQNMPRTERRSKFDYRPHGEQDAGVGICAAADIDASSDVCDTATTATTAAGERWAERTCCINTI